MTSIMLNKGAHGFQWKLIKRPWIFDGFGSAPIKQLSRLTSAPCCNSSNRPRRPNPPCTNAPANFRSYRSAPAARGGGVPADHSQRRLQAQPPLPSGSATPSNTSTRGSPSRTCSEDPAPRGTPSPTNTSIVDSSHTHAARVQHPRAHPSSTRVGATATTATADCGGLFAQRAKLTDSADGGRACRNGNGQRTNIS